MTARDWMSTAPRSVPPMLSVWAALAIMREEDIRHLLVVDQGRLVGVLSNRDFRKILEWTRPDGTLTGLRDVVVARIMTPVDRVVTVPPEASLLDVARLIIRRKIGCVPVVTDAARPCGILTQKDVMRALITLAMAADAR